MDERDAKCTHNFMNDKGNIILMMQLKFKKIVSKYHQQLFKILIENIDEMEKKIILFFLILLYIIVLVLPYIDLNSPWLR